MFAQLFERYRDLPRVWWCLVFYIVVVNATDAFTVYKSLVFSDFQEAGVGTVGILLATFAIGTCVCNLFFGAFIDRSKNLKAWLIVPKILSGLFVMLLYFKQALPFLVVTVFSLSISLFVSNLTIYKLIKLLSDEKEKKESMLVLFSTVRHLGWLFSTLFAFFLFKSLGPPVLLVDGSVTVACTLGLLLVLKSVSVPVPQPAQVNAEGGPSVGFFKILSEHWLFFFIVMLSGVIYSTSAAGVIPLLLKMRGQGNYVAQFSVLSAASTAGTLLMPLLFALVRNMGFGKKTVLFMAGHMSLALLYFILPMNYGWLLALPIYGLLCLWGEAFLTALFSEATVIFDNAVFGRVAGYFELMIFVGIAISGSLTKPFVESPQLFYGCYLIIPVFICLFVKQWLLREKERKGGKARADAALLGNMEEGAMDAAAPTD